MQQLASKNRKKIESVGGVAGVGGGAVVILITVIVVVSEGPPACVIRAFAIRSQFYLCFTVALPLLCRCL